MSGITDENLIFFNRKGDALNLNYNDASERYEGSLFFDENSNDTYRSMSLFTFERIPAFDYELNDGSKEDYLYLNKFRI
jgi:hypothetical protein